MSQVLLGAKIDMNDASNTYGIPLGMRYTDNAGKMFMFVQAGEAITQYMYVSVSATGSATKLTKTNLDTRRFVGCAQVALTNAYYGWVQIRGAHTGLVKASCAADVKLYSSATAGYIDDDPTSQTAVLGVVLTAARTSSDGIAAGLFTVEPQTT